MSGPGKEAAALVLLFCAESRWHVVLVVRGTHGRHAGQLALPGGNREPGDATLAATALRETQEEIGVPANEVEVLTELRPIPTRTTGYVVTPFIGRIGPRSRWRVDGAEVVGVCTPAVEAILDPSRRELRKMTFPTWPEPREVEVVQIGPHLLWGFTLRVLDAALPRVAAHLEPFPSKRVPPATADEGP